MSTKRIVRAVNATTREMESFSSTFGKELARVLRELERQLRPLLDDAAEGSRTAIVRAAKANETRRGIREALEAAGYDQLAQTATSAPLDTLAARVLQTRRLAQAVVRVSQAHEQRIAALQALHYADLLDLGEDLSKGLWRATARGVFASAPPQKILRDLASVIDDTEPHIRTFYDTAVSIYTRQVEAMQASDREDVPFLYAGPIDEKVRPFCLRLVGQVLTRADIDALDNEQLDNVFLTGGGYNCRHQWVEVSQLSETADLVGTGERIPEYAPQVDELEEAARAA